MPDEIIEIDEDGKVHGLDPNYVRGEGEQLSSHVASAWSLAVDLKEHAGRSEAGRWASVLATKLEECRALIAYWHMDELRIERSDL